LKKSFRNVDLVSAIIIVTHTRQREYHVRHLLVPAAQDMTRMARCFAIVYNDKFLILEPATRPGGG